MRYHYCFFSALHMLDFCCYHTTDVCSTIVDFNPGELDGALSVYAAIKCMSATVSSIHRFVFVI